MALSTFAARAREAVDFCRVLASCTDEPGFTTRTFLSPPMREVHARLESWMERAGMTVRVDEAGNLRGVYPAAHPDAPRLFIGSHLDTVPRAGAFDGVLGVVLAVALVESLDGQRFPFAIETVGFSEEEGVRFGVPFIGSRALVGTVDDELLSRQDANGISVRDALEGFGLDPSRIGAAKAGPGSLGYLEFHIEQGPVLDVLGLPLGVVDAIVGQTRLALTFTGAARHAGTTPMYVRRDAVAGAAEWIVTVEREARSTPGLLATVGRMNVAPGATNVIAGTASVSLDVRHAVDAVRTRSVAALVEGARTIAAQRHLTVAEERYLDEPAVAMSPQFAGLLERALARTGMPVHRMPSGAGHDAMIVGAHMPAAMLFLRTPSGISHHPDESVVTEDVAAAMAAGRAFLDELARECHG